MAPFVDFETDPDAPGVHWEKFVSALGVWVYMQAAPPSVAAAAAAWNTTPGAVRKAVMEHPWLVDMWATDEADPEKQIIESDGE